MKNFLMICISILFFNTEASDSKKKSSDSSKAAQQISTKAKSADNQKDKKELKLTENAKSQTEEEIFAAYQVEAQESRKKVKQLKSRLKVSLEDSRKLVTLCKFIDLNSIDLVKECILEFPLHVINMPYFGETALIGATFKGHLDIVKELLAHKADPNIKRNDGMTALIFAAQEGHLDIVKELLAHKADPNIQRNDGATALIFAAEKDYLGIVKELLVYKSTDLNIKRNDGMTALIRAVAKGHLDIVKELLAHKANPNIQRNDGATALTFAAEKGCLDIVKELLTHKANPNIQRNDGTTALIFAAQEGHLNIVKELLTDKANPNIQRNDGTTALIFATQEGYLDIVKELLNKGAEIDLKNEKGFTSIMIAHYKYALSPTENYKKIIELLEDYGATITSEEQAKINYYVVSSLQLDQKKALKNELLKVVQLKKIDEKRKDLDKNDTGLLVSKEFIETSKEESAERKKLFDLFDLEKRQIRQAENIKNAETKKFKNLIKQLEEEKKELEALAKSDRSERELSKPKTFEDVIQQKGGLTDLQKNIAKFHFDKLLSSKQINNLISQEEDLNYSFGKDLFGLGSVSFDWSHIINLSIGWEYDFKTNLYVPSFEGGHSKETIDRLIQSGLVKKISEKKWKNGCAEYVLENIWTGKRFSKTVFPANFDISNIYTAITQGKIKKKEETSKESFLNPKIEMVIEYNNILIKAVLAKQFFGYEIITAFPVEKIENPIAKSSMPAISYAPSPAAKSSY